MPNQHGEFIWYELLTGDADAAQQFYSAVLGWDIPPSVMPDIDYRILHAREDGADPLPVGGLMQLTEEMRSAGARPVWLGYIAVDDVDKAIASITAAGGSVQMPATDIADVGRIALLTDPQGTPFYVMRGLNNDTSYAFAFDRPRVGHCAWNELNTSDAAAAKDFYFREFGWSKDGEMDMGPMGAYEFIRHNGVIGAMMPMAEEMPVPLWHYYFRVTDIDAAVQTVQANGGTVFLGPDEIPGGDFVIKGFDPQGALFSLIGRKTS